MSSCLVTGASGFIGKALCQALLDKNYLVHPLSRQDYDFNAANEHPFPARLLQGIDIVFHLGGMAHVHAKGAKDRDFWIVNVEGTRGLLEALEQSSIQRFIYFSSVKASNPDDAYGHSKAAAETLVLNFAEKTGKFVTILRPALVYGPGMKGNLASMLKAIQQGWFPPLPDNGNRRSMVSLHDVVKAAILCAENEIARGKIYTLTDGHPYSSHEIYQIMRHALNLKPLHWSIPDKLLQLIFRLINRKDIYQKLLGSAEYSSEQIQKELAWKPSSMFLDILFNL